MGQRLSSSWGHSQLTISVLEPATGTRYSSQSNVFSKKSTQKTLRDGPALRVPWTTDLSLTSWKSVVELKYPELLAQRAIPSPSVCTNAASLDSLFPIYLWYRGNPWKKSWLSSHLWMLLRTFSVKTMVEMNCVHMEKECLGKKMEKCCIFCDWMAK